MAVLRARVVGVDGRRRERMIYMCRKGDNDTCAGCEWF